MKNLFTAIAIGILTAAPAATILAATPEISMAPPGSGGTSGGESLSFANGGSSSIATWTVGDGTASAGIGGTAGLNSGVTYISDVSFTGGTSGDTYPFSTTVTLNGLTWGPGVTMVGTTLTLGGTVTLSGPGSEVDITLTGLLGGPENTIHETYCYNSTPGANNTIILDVVNVNQQATASSMTETLDITLTGPASYSSDPPTFSVPEVSPTALLAALGFGLCLLGERRLRLSAGN